MKGKAREYLGNKQFVECMTAIAMLFIGLVAAIAINDPQGSLLVFLLGVFGSLGYMHYCERSRLEKRVMILTMEQEWLEARIEKLHLLLSATGTEIGTDTLAMLEKTDG